jgi:hypothetical protein
MTAAIVQFQQRQEAKFICSACGADRGCQCNAPAVEKLAEMREQARQRDRTYKERKSQQKQQPGDVANEDVEDIDTPEQFWQRSLGNLASDSIAMRAAWRRQFGAWEKFETPSDLITLAKRAAEAWSVLADELAGEP